MRRIKTWETRGRNWVQKRFFFISNKERYSNLKEHFICCLMKLNSGSCWKIWLWKDNYCKFDWKILWSLKWRNPIWWMKYQRLVSLVVSHKSCNRLLRTNFVFRNYLRKLNLWTLKWSIYWIRYSWCLQSSKCTWFYRRQEKLSSRIWDSSWWKRS